MVRPRESQKAAQKNQAMLKVAEVRIDHCHRKVEGHTLLPDAADQIPQGSRLSPSSDPPHPLMCGASAAQPLECHIG
jgi:hypothetical protein